MDPIGMFSKSLSRKSVSPDRDPLPNGLGRYHPLQAQIPRTLPSPTLYPIYEDQNTFDGERQEGCWHDCLESLSQSLHDTPGSQETTYHRYQDSRGNRKHDSEERLGSIKEASASSSIDSPDGGAKVSNHPSPLQSIGRQSAGRDEKPGKLRTARKTSGTASNEKDLQGELSLRLDTLTISDNITNETSLDTRAAAVHGSGTSQSPGSSIYLKEALFDTHSTGIYIGIAQRRQLPTQQLIINATPLFQTRTQSYNQVTRGHTAASGNPTHSNVNSSRTNGEANQSGSSTRQSAAPKKRKLNQQSDEEGSDDEEQAPSRTPKDKQDETKLVFACPYLKHDKTRHSLETCCNGRGWADIDRLKHHRRAMRCRRCQTKFGKSPDLSAHQEEEPPCKESNEPTWDVFDEEQEKLLRSRKGLSKLTKPEKWQKIYHILFPDVAEAEIPSPYSSPDDTQSVMDHFAQQLPGRVVGHLEKSLKALGLNVHTGQIVECVKDAIGKGLEDLLQNQNEFAESQSPEYHRHCANRGVAAGNSHQPSTQQEETFGGLLAPGPTRDLDPFGFDNLPESFYQTPAPIFMDSPVGEAVP
ncbi:hypothetical protein PFICI_06372 [Pestalotiopsis fici W106-1]|uniref:C2H2-type domain-containing protein n=1 Tax=Pestalotiopsis fici (strain W106-1 / CGMCC3.15140) TaxID=1229662 RepID=W3X5P3_PESFW|nr:uncharacterized protein PFICI_06372 [Pestalotiopsis fici W106-1]ETS81370.1 hypothetical protein PFICI_06372 [Pestalotiopsis fici W106-1]